MLQINKRQSVDLDSAEAGLDFGELIGFIRSTVRLQIWIMLFVATLITAIGATYIFITPPTYTARAAMIIDRGKVQVELGGILKEAPIEIDSQIQLIKSETIASSVVRKLGLANDAEFTDPPAGLRGWIRKLLRSGSEGSNSKPDPASAAMARLSDNVRIDRTGFILEIEFSSLKPERAAEIANAFADCYIEDRLKSKQQAAQEAGHWLKDQIQELRDQSLRADEAVVAFKAKKNIVAADGRLVSDQEITLLNNQLVLAREKTAETRARLDRIDTIIGSSSPKEGIATVTDTLNNPIIVKLRTQYLDFVNREAVWSREYGTDHLAVVNLRRQIREIQSSINDELRRIGETYRSDFEIAKQRQAGLEKAVADAVSQSQETSQALTTLRTLESSAETFRGLYRSALERGTELVQKQSFPGVEARLITRASVPTSHSSPKTLLVLGASVVGGLLLGFGVGALRVSMDRVFRTPRQIETFLHARCLALVPAVKPRRRMRRVPTPRGARIVKREANVIWNVVDQPLARFAEAMRAITSEARLHRPDKSSTALGFTSSLPKEGKSTIAAAFALLTAQSGVRSILVDCDLRNPALTAMLAPSAEFGLLEVLSGKKQLEEVLWTVPTTGLAFLPAVIDRSRVAESSVILGSPLLRALFDKLRDEYPCVLADFSPAAPIVDVRATAGLVDAYVFVIEWSRTTIEVAELALSKAAVVQQNLLGVVLNKVDFKNLRKYEGHRSDYYSDKTYSQYGQV
jgi:succinoglycan biosynthesis transport protein ExoP